VGDMDDLLTTKEVAAITRAPLSTLRYWRQIGVGPRCFHLGRRVVYWRREVNKWLAECEHAEHRTAG
jgi:predicted DNA-binding transcriptional regulator AlpA